MDRLDTMDESEDLTFDDDNTIGIQRGICTLDDEETYTIQTKETKGTQCTFEEEAE